MTNIKLMIAFIVVGCLGMQGSDRDLVAANLAARRTLTQEGQRNAYQDLIEGLGSSMISTEDATEIVRSVIERGTDISTFLDAIDYRSRMPQYIHPSWVETNDQALETAALLYRAGISESYFSPQVLALVRTVAARQMVDEAIANQAVVRHMPA